MNTPSHNEHTFTQLEDDIRAGKIKMKPKIYFIATYGLSILGILLILFFCIYIGSFALFALRANGIFLLPSLGWRGLRVFLYHVPWFLLVLVALFVITLEWTGRRFTLVYRRPLLYSSVVILCIVSLGSILMEKSSIHRKLFHTTSSHRVPFISPFYKGYGELHPTDFHIVLLLEKQGLVWQVKNRFNEYMTVLVDRETEFPFGHEIHIGDRLLVIGDKKDDIVHARIIRRLQPNALPE